MPAVSDAPPPKNPSRLANPTLSSQKERKKANPDSKNNKCVYKACSSITVLSCHSSSRGGRWGKAGEALPEEAEERIARNGGEEKSKEERGKN